MLKVLFIFCIITAFSGLVLGQSKTITNTDLEKYKQKRVQAEKDLKEYYQKAGLTDEDLAKREADEAKSRETLSTRLRVARLEQERLSAEARVREEYTRQVNVVVPQQTGYEMGYILYGDRFYPVRGPWSGRFQRGVTWRATPMGIIYEPGSRSSNVWSPPQRQRLSPAWRTQRRFR